MNLSELYRDIVESSPDGLWVIDLDGRTVYANPEIARLHRIADEGLAALTVFDTLDEDGRARFRAHLHGVREGRLYGHPFEVQWVRSDGTTQWVLCSETALLDDAGRPRALVRRYSDNTERHELIVSLQASEDALEDQVAQNDLMQAVASAANQAATLGEVLVQARSLVLLHDDWERARAFVPVPEGSGQVEPFYPDDDDRDKDVGDPRAAAELVLAQRAHDARRPVWDEAKLTIAFPILLGTEVYAVVAITSAPPLYRHELIETMAGRVAEQLARVAERERRPGQLAARPRRGHGGLAAEVGVPGHHEPRDPDAAQRRDRPQRPAAAHRARPTTSAASPSGVQGAGRTLLGRHQRHPRLLQDRGRRARARGGRLRRPPAPRPDGRHPRRVGRREGLGPRRSRVDDDVPDRLVGDPTRLGQVLSNLISNAIKFTSVGEVAGAGARRRARPGRRAARRRGRRHRYRHPPGPMDRLFEPFRQADASTTRTYGGTGLGLAISRQLVDRDRRRHRVPQHPGRGQQFWFTARLSTSRPGVPPPRGRRAPPPQRRAAGTARCCWSRTTRSTSWSRSASSSRSATPPTWPRTARRRSSGASDATYDAILMDLQMPVLDGFAATRQIRARRERPRRSRSSR